jgi:hypothetical protein
MMITDGDDNYDFLMTLIIIRRYLMMKMTIKRRWCLYFDVDNDYLMVMMIVL